MFCGLLSLWYLQVEHAHTLAWSPALQVLAGSNEQLLEAQKEIKVMTQLHHPNLLPLLAQAIVPDRRDGHMLQLVYMLFPVYEASMPSAASTPSKTG